ncbi:MAG TPA: glycoside hydrolase family 16 protein [Thermoplasmata archaeon]|nr:glycoside hydrolase family 16 protein [Thermoplasmata archaeon]
MLGRGYEKAGRRCGDDGATQHARGATATLPLALLAMALTTCGWEPPGSSSPPSGNLGAAPASAPSSAGSPSTGDGLQPPGYKLVWRDEFDGGTLDASRWSASSGARRDALNTPDAVAVANGSLVITTYIQGGVPLTGFLSTEGKFDVTYGYVEARIRLHEAAGTWCAFWINSPTNGTPLNDPGTAGTEIDVLEHRYVDQYGNDVSDVDAINVNWNGYGADHTFEQRTVTGSPSLQDNWHNYGVLWTPTGYTFYIDGAPVWTPGADVPVSHRSENLYLTCEVQNNSWAGSVPPGGYGSRDTSANRMEVDWVRVWQPSP